MEASEFKLQKTSLKFMGENNTKFSDAVPTSQG